MSEKLIVQHCSPTLAGMKTGSLFSCRMESRKALSEYVRCLNRRLVRKGLRVIPVCISERRALIYLYRPAQLERDFSEKMVQDILRQHGYACENPEQCVTRLMVKIREQGEFPHEIGVFLGYPPEDVKGFIEHKADCFKCVGYWKVYGDQQRAEKIFAKYRKCTDVYCRQWERGTSIEKLAVAM